MSFLVSMVADVEGITYADVQKDLKATIARSVDVRRNVRRVQRHVRMEPVSRITFVSVNLVGLANYATKISRGLRD